MKGEDDWIIDYLEDDEAECTHDWSFYKKGEECPYCRIENDPTFNIDFNKGFR